MSAATMTTLSEFTPAPPLPRARRLFDRAAWISFLIIVPVAALLLGIQLRHHAWDQTEDIRYTTDIDNAFEQGTQALKVGFIARYDEERSHPKRNEIVSLDYAPGRLAIATLWTRWVYLQTEGRVPDLDRPTAWGFSFYAHAAALRSTWRLCRPLMELNICGELLSAGAVFTLVFRYSTRGGPGRRRVVLGLFGALLFWFNPAVIWNAHVWPQWDTWVFPFLLWAVVAAGFDAWFTAGALMAAGAMFKGQVLFGLPLFVVWPVARGRPLQLARFLTGLGFIFAAVTCVWDVRNAGTGGVTSPYVPGVIVHDSVFWIASCMAALGMVIALAKSDWPWFVRVPVAAAAIVAVDWAPYGLPVWNNVVLAGLAVGSCAVFFRPARSLPVITAGWIAGAVLLCLPVFHNTNAWYEAGFHRGTSDRPRMASDESNNLGLLLSQVWHWELTDSVWTFAPGPRAEEIDKFLISADPAYKEYAVKRDAELAAAVKSRAWDRAHHLRVNEPLPEKRVGLPVKYLMVAMWLVAAIACGVAAAVHDRRRSPRFLLAVAAPWVVLFAIAPQMHQRYLLWGAGLATAAAAVSPGLLLLDLLMMGVAVLQEFMAMVNQRLDEDRRPYGHWRTEEYKPPAFYEWLHRFHPGISWAVLLTAAVYLYLALRPGRSRNASFEPRRWD